MKNYILLTILSKKIMLKLIQYRGASMSIYDSKQNRTEEGISPEGKVVQLLSEMIDHSKNMGKSLYIEDSQLEIEPHIMQIKNGIAQVAFVLKHPLFQEEIVESVVGVGPTSDESIKGAAVEFVASAFTVIEHALKEESGQKISVKLPYYQNQFNLYQSKVKVQGSKKQKKDIDYWLLLGEEIIKQLGNKRVYFIKIYAAKTGDTVNCECRVNGMVYPSFTNMLKEIAKQWDIETSIYSEKQFFILVQEESTYKPYPLSKKEVEQLVLSSLLLYRECNSQEAYDSLEEKMHKICPVSSLATELFAFVPEIFTEVIFSEVNYLDKVVLIKGEEEIEISKHQLTAYDWIHAIVERTIRAGYYEKEQVDRIISCSASLNCINQALKDGSKLENLYTGGIAIPVRGDYEIL